MYSEIMTARRQTASFDVHTQKTFTMQCPNELPVPEGETIVPELNAQASKTHLRIGSKEAHPLQPIWLATPERPSQTPISGHNVDVTWPAHARPGTLGFELLDGLPAITEYDYFIWEGIELDMHPYGACYHDLNETLSTGVIEFLRYHGIDTVIVGGLALDYCVKVTALQLLRAEFRVIINEAACRGLTPETSAEAINTLHAHGALIVKQAASIVND